MIKLQEVHLIHLLLLIYLWEKKKKKEETAFLDFTDPQQDLCILSLSPFSKLQVFVAFNIAVFNKTKGKLKSNEMKTDSDQDKRVMHSLNGLLRLFPVLVTEEAFSGLRKKLML